MRWLASAATAALLLAGCSGGGERLQSPAPGVAVRYAGYDATGLASWYGEEVAGNRTASGERFDPDGFTVAHRTLPLGSVVEVTVRDTGRSILARVTDRGPGRRDREIDLSRGAARLLGTDRRSVAAVRVRAVTLSVAQELELRTGRPIVTDQGRSTFDHTAAASTGGRRPLPPPLASDGSYMLQVASYSSAARARVVAAALDATVIPAGEVWRVRLGPYRGADAVQQARDAVAMRGYADAQILPVN
jgi:rare lipoprotein A